MTFLYERDDFPELIESAASFHGIQNPAIIEKDYYVTEALRLIGQRYGDQIIFKGGTSLSKGWKLIQRFSEDIDLYINPGQRGEHSRQNLLKALAATVAQHPKLTEDESQTERIKGVARTTVYTYPPSGAWPGIRPNVLLEAGIQSGTFPTEPREIRSLLGEFLTEQGVSLESNELDPFSLPVLHFRRTVIEKLYALHHKVERGFLQEQKPIGTYARHYYDVSQLLSRPEVQAMLTDPAELITIATDYRRLTQLYFPNQLLPAKMNLSLSKALFPDTSDLRDHLAQAYGEQCISLCYGAYPSFDEVLALLEAVKEALQVNVPEETQDNVNSPE